MANLQSYAILFLIWLLSTLLTRPRCRLPPSPIALPIIGHLHLLGPFPHQSFHKLSTHYGPLLRLRLGSVPAVVASSPDAAQKILKTHEISFASRPIPSAERHLSYDSSGFAFAPYGPYWKFIKKLCMSELLGGRTIEMTLPIRVQELRSFLQLLLERSKAGETVDVSAELSRMTSNVISMMAMRKRCSRAEGEGEVWPLLQEMAEVVGRFNLSDFIGLLKNLDLQGLEKRYKDLHWRLDGILERIIKEHEQERRIGRKRGVDGDSDKDLVDILLDISEDEKAEMKLTRENIKAFVLDIFAAGTDTSAITTEWALAELMNHPTMLKKAREEIDAVVGKERLVEESDIPNLPCIQAIVKETLRLHPATPLIFRKSTDDCKISGYDIPSNTHIFINVWAIGRDPNHWEDSLEFRPERFMPSDGGSSRIDVRGQHFHLLPFGSGRRACPGTTLAMHLVQTTVAAMVQSFDWKINNCKNGEENVRVDMTEGVGMTVSRAKPLVCFPIVRVSPLLIDPAFE
ncbi:Cytochrome P450 [Cinnamomum micranthum f. kanehirae]|uniref:Cytochrome P450 n=1 Tax=Cinnamomum micranthum f. kanehirae TaxID=337451 RepID=A0A3S3MZC7_9MAGN|nr:Cytochrome P450 [Cinnamomum micranthum f. kanehirae]